MTNSAQKHVDTPIRLGVENWIGFAPLYIADEKFFKENNVDVELVFYDTDYKDRFNDYVDGKLHGVAGVYADFIYHDAHGIHSKIVYVTDYSGTADVIIGNVSSVSELRGKKIGIEGIYTFSHFFVLNTLEKAGLGEKDVEFVIVPHSETMTALEENKIDAGHTWDPVKTQLVKKGYKIIASATQTPGIITEVVGFSPEFVSNNPAKIQAFVNSLNQAQVFLNTNNKESVQIVAKTLNTTTEDIEGRFSDVHILSLQENIVAMKKSDELKSLYGSGSYIGEIMLERGQIIRMPNFDELIEPKFVMQSIHNNK
jgi:NitT/TauT family transport system substrate-binding protein